ncbi:hypothetical protein PHMEG_00018934, partial [Phytophthora megakarya]
LSGLLELEKLLHRVKPKYLLPKCYVRTKGSRMSEKDKDDLDADLVELIKNCSSRIDALKTVVEMQAVVSSVEEYQREVVTYLLERLKNIADNAKQMQKKRYHQLFLLSSRLLPEDDRQDLDALEENIMLMRKDEGKKKKITVSSLRNVEAVNLSSPTSPKSPMQPPVSNPSSPVAASLAPTTAQPGIRQHSTPKTRKTVRGIQQTPVFASLNDELEFTEEEDRRFRVENVVLHRHFQENLEDAKYVACISYPIVLPWILI